MPEARHPRKGSPPSFPALVQQFFTEYLVAQRALSSRTVASYRDAMTLFLGYATEQLGKTPTAVQLIDITPELVLKFLAHLERERHNSVRSRNLRLTALRSFLKFAGRRDVTALHAVERVMAVPMKRFERPLLGHLRSFGLAGCLTAGSWGDRLTIPTHSELRRVRSLRTMRN